MKTKNWAFFVLTILLILIWPLTTFAASDDGHDPSFEHVVKCVVLPEYDFSMPGNAEIMYPTTSIDLGKFVVGDLLLRSGETLSVSLSLGQMSGSNGESLIYNLVSSVPNEIESTHSGASYDLALSIDNSVFEKASEGIYSAPLLFRVISNFNEEVVWSQTIYVKAIKSGSTSPSPSNNVNTNTSSYENTSDSEETDEPYSHIGQQEISENTYEEPKSALILTDEEENARAEEIIEDEDIPLGQQVIGDKIPYWIYILGGGILFFILSCLFIIFSRYDENEAK